MHRSNFEWRADRAATQGTREDKGAIWAAWLKAFINLSYKLVKSKSWKNQFNISMLGAMIDGEDIDKLKLKKRNSVLLTKELTVMRYN